MIKLLLNWLILAGLLLGLDYILPGLYVAGLTTALAAVFAMGFVQMFIKPILSLLTLPLNLLTLGLFSFVLNAFLFWLASLFVPGFQVDFLGAIIASFIMGLFSTVLYRPTTKA
jgi:putative membrane protein